MLSVILQNDMTLLKHGITVVMLSVILLNDVASSKDYCHNAVSRSVE
jgi:hypothetical protein